MLYLNVPMKKHRSYGHIFLLQHQFAFNCTAFYTVTVRAQEFTDKRKNSLEPAPEAAAPKKPSRLRAMMGAAMAAAPSSYTALNKDRRLSVNLFGRINGLDLANAAIHPSQVSPQAHTRSPLSVTGYVEPKEAFAL